MLKHALILAREHGPAAAAMRAYFNLAATHIESDRYADAVAEVDRGLEFARERGDRGAERDLQSQKLVPLARLGRWDEAMAIGEAVRFTSTTIAPWTAVRANDQRRARLETIRHVLLAVDYEGRDLKAIGKADPLIIASGRGFFGTS